MEKLKTDNLILVFSQLSLINDKLQCILVCKRWYIIMAENFLYKQLNFKNIENFDKAIDLFDKKQKFGYNVEILTINGCEIDAVPMFLLPRQFPNVKTLIWKEDLRPLEERITNDISIKHLPQPRVYQRELRKWNQLQSIDIRIERLPLMTMLLESSSLEKLTHLKISFNQYHLDKYFGTETLLKLRPIVKSLINNIKNSPSLETLDMSCSVLDLDDMEKLHFSAPKLKSIDLYCTAILDDFTVNNEISIAQNRSSVIIEFSITVFTMKMSASIYNVESNLKNTIKKWLIYIGCKYNGANFIKLQGWSNFYLPKIHELEQPMLTIIGNMRNITEYHAFFYPITKSIIDAMDDRETGLKKLDIYTHELNSIATQLKHVELSRQAKTIRNLNINSDLMTLKESAGLDSIISTVSHQRFQALINLKITCIIQHRALITLFLALPFLKTLSLNLVNFDADDDIQVVPIIKSKIQYLHLTFICTADSTMYQPNYVLDFILQSCSLLINFTLNGKMRSSNIPLLRLCFFDHNELKKITVNFSAVQYYTFSWINRKQGYQWANYNELSKTHDSTGRKFHIDIAWRNKNIQLELAKAPVK